MKEYKQSKTLLILKIIMAIFSMIPLITIPFSIIYLIVVILKYNTTKLNLKEHDLSYTYGILSTTNTDLKFRDIQTISIKKTLIGRMFHYGNIILITGSDTGNIYFQGIDNPEIIKQEINAQIRLVTTS